MTFRPNKERFILLFAATTAALYIVFTQADELSGFLVNAAILVLPVGSTLFWLSRFEIRFEGSQIFYRSLFGGKVQFQESDIVSINTTDLRNLIHLVYTKQTLFIDLKNGDQIKINTKVFPAEVTEKMKQLTTRLQNNGGI